MGTAHEKSVAESYADQLATLRLNSKPLINSLTMMAEDYIKQAPEIVQTIEKHLTKAKPEVKLPILYLIDSIVKNVKRDYVELFTQDIISTFCNVFELVDVKTRTQMFKLRQTWNDVFPMRKLSAIDMKIREIDPGWPTPQSSSIHVNPKFLTKAISTSITNTPNDTPNNSSVSAMDIEEARMREELLIKQKELIVLQQKKLELEIMQSKAKLAEQGRLKQAHANEGKEEQLLKQAEMAKQQTNKAASIIAKASSGSSSKNSPKAHDNLLTITGKNEEKHVTQIKSDKYPTDPRLARLNSKPRNLSLDNSKTRNSLLDEKTSPKKNKFEPLEKVKSEQRDGKRPLDDEKDQKRKKRKYVEEIDTSAKNRERRDKSRDNDNKHSPEKVDKSSKNLPEKVEKSRSKSSSSERKEKSWKPDKDKDRHSNQEQTSSGSPTKAEIRSERSSNSNSEDNKEPSKVKVEKIGKERDKETYNSRKSAVLSRSYRKKPEARFDLDEPNEKMKVLDVTSPLDFDLRFAGLQDVDLRKHGSSEDKAEGPSPTKKSRKSTIIDDLFGQEDVDMRQHSNDISWSQMKKLIPNKEPDEEIESHIQDDRQSQDEDIRQILVDVGNRPPPAISPANSVDSIRSSCDSLGRPLLFARLPVDPEERKRSLDTRSLSIDPVEQFRVRYLERPCGLTALDLKLACNQAKVELDRGALDSEQYNVILKQLVQLNVPQKIRELQEARRGPMNPWTGGGNIWAVDGPTFNNRAMRLPAPAPGPWSMNEWGQAPVRPLGPNPFVEAVAFCAPMLPMSVSLPNGRQRFLRFGKISPAAGNAIRMRLSGSYSRGRGRGDAGRSRLPFPTEPTFKKEPRLDDNPLDVLATVFPTTDKKDFNHQNAYKSDSIESNPREETGASGPVDVQNLLSKLMMAGLLPSAPKEESKNEPSSSDGNKEEPMETSQEEAEKTTPAPPPLDVVVITFNDNLKERRDKLIKQVCTGVQCGSCGLRFPPDQSLRYTQHLDWHFRLNRREKSNQRKAQSRRWYYDLSDWIQFEEIEDLEERAASLFEFQGPEKADLEDKDTSTILNPDSYTVAAAGFEHAKCPQCGEDFETFYDSEEDEWKLRDALVDKTEEGEMRVFHPICHEDYVATLAKEAAELSQEPLTAMETDTLNEVPSESEGDIPAKETQKPDVDDDDEVLILREGKKEVVLMEIELEDDEDQIVSNNEKIRGNEKEKDETENNNTLKDNGSNIISNDSANAVSSPIVIHVEDDSNIPGITSSQGGSGVFDFALSSGGSQNQNSQPELAPIIYKSMHFEFPKIKVEPPEWSEVDENQVIMSKEYLVDSSQAPLDITLDDDDSPSTVAEESSRQDVDIDLTADDDEASSHSFPSTSLVSAIDGNMELRSETSAPLLNVPAKIRINISGLDTRAGSQSPGKQVSSQDEDISITLKKSPLVSHDTSSHSLVTDNLSEKKLEEIKRLKPRLIGRKLVNCPPKKTGREESGLCTIC